MAGDVEVHEELVLGQAADETAATSLAFAAEQANAHVLHYYGPRVAVAQSIRRTRPCSPRRSRAT